MLYNIKVIPLHRVFHGIRFKVKKIGCRDDNQFFLCLLFYLFKSLNVRENCGLCERKLCKYT